MILNGTVVVDMSLAFPGFDIRVSQHKSRFSKAVGCVGLDGDDLIPIWRESFLCFWPIYPLVIQEEVD
jgi:hypothetical protein